MGKDIDFKKNIGQNKFVTISSNYLCVDFRVFFKANGSTELHASKRSLAFNLADFIKLKKFVYMMEWHFTCLIFLTMNKKYVLYLNCNSKTQLYKIE